MRRRALPDDDSDADDDAVDDVESTSSPPASELGSDGRTSDAEKDGAMESGDEAVDALDADTETDEDDGGAKRRRLETTAEGRSVRRTRSPRRGVLRRELETLRAEVKSRPSAATFARIELLEAEARRRRLLLEEAHLHKRLKTQRGLCVRLLVRAMKAARRRRASALAGLGAENGAEGEASGGGGEEDEATARRRKFVRMCEKKERQAVTLLGAAKQLGASCPRPARPPCPPIVLLPERRPGRRHAAAQGGPHARRGAGRCAASVRPSAPSSL